VLLDGPRICDRRKGISERTRRSSRQNSQRWRTALDCARSWRSGMKISAVLLAGGESRRMGKDKATLLFRGKPLWQIQRELLRKLAPTELFVSARTDPPWRPADAQFVADDPPSRGPLSGLAASLAKTRTKHLLALAIDMPFMTEKYLTFLCSQIEPHRGVIAKIEDRFEPLAAIYPQEALANVQSALSGEDFSLQTVTGSLVAAGKLQVLPVESQERKLFLNLNELSDLAAL
jgi:molybdenum cofactor guanylyltransferase